MAESAQINTGVGKKNTSDQKQAMTNLLNFLPILGSSETGMKDYNVDSMLTQLKKVYAEKQYVQVLKMIVCITIIC